MSLPEASASSKALDDRGRPIEDARAWANVLGPPEHRLRRLAVFTRLTRVKYDRRSRPSLLTALRIGVVLLPVPVLAVAFIMLGAGVSLAIVFAASVAGVVVSSLVRSRREKRAESEVITRSLAAEGFCGGCGYSLEGLGPDDLGLLVCPECGAAWHRLRVTRPHWVEARPEPPGNARWWTRLISVGVRSVTARCEPDDRGQAVPIVDRRLLCLPPDSDAFGSDAQRRALRRRLRRIDRGRRWIAAGCFLALAAATGTVCWWYQFPPQVLLTLFILVVGAAAMLAGDSVSRNAPIRREMLRLGRCPACARGLAGLPIDEQGFRVCPGCGSSWRADGNSDAAAVPERVAEPRTQVGGVSE